MTYKIPDLFPLLPDERRLHEKAIPRIEKQLFRTHKPEEFHIVPGSRIVMPAHASEIGLPESRVRSLGLGGLRFRLKCPYGRTFNLTVDHRAANKPLRWGENHCFDIYVLEVDVQKEYVVLNQEAVFDTLDTKVLWCVRRATQVRAGDVLQTVDIAARSAVVTSVIHPNKGPL